MHLQYTSSDTARFWIKVDRNGPVPTHCPELGPCWLWTGQRKPHGYGHFWLNGGTRRAHRVAWLLTYHNWPTLFICHRCDVTLCCNPRHMFLGTTTDNQRDAVAKGRTARGIRNGHATHPECAPRGEAHPHARFTDMTVRAVRQAHQNGMAIRALARAYNVSQCAIQGIVRRRTWKHVL